MQKLAIIIRVYDLSCNIAYNPYLNYFLYNFIFTKFTNSAHPINVIISTMLNIILYLI